MKKLFSVAIALLAGLFAIAQAPSTTRHKMAIFTPLYLDEAFDAAGNYKYSGKNFPTQSIKGLEFYHGVLLAIDSLNKQNIPLDVYVYDTKSSRETIEQQFSKCAADGVELILANCTIAELSKLARLGADKKITVLNATVPNDANTSDNPYFLVLNPTLQTQIEGLYNYLKSNYAGKEITFITRNMQSEKYIKDAFEKLNKYSNEAVKLKFRPVNDEIALKALGTTTQPTQAGVYVVGSLDTEFGHNVLKQFATNSNNYASLTVIGMPTWENLKLSSSDYKGVEIIYSTPFYHAGNNPAAKAIVDYYNKKMYARPSDLVFRAYGLTYRFGKLLNQYGKDINNNLAAKIESVFFDFDIQPVYLNGKIRNYENKKLYFLKYKDGNLIAVN